MFIPTAGASPFSKAKGLAFLPTHNHRVPRRWPHWCAAPAAPSRLRPEAELDRFQYLALMAGCLLITLPLEFWLSARVYRRPRRMVLAVVPVALLFIAWDLFAIQRDHWTFSPEHTTGIVFPGGIPLEEVVFFLVIPICGLLTYEAVGTVLRARGLDKLDRRDLFQSQEATDA